jgi:hypothetical protein
MMMIRKSLELVLTMIVLLTMEAGCAAASARLYIRTGPPPVVVERGLVSPGPGFVWQPGYYRWTGRQYDWVAGRYERAPRAHARWVAGRWAHDRHGWYFIDGHWR